MLQFRVRQDIPRIRCGREDSQEIVCRLDSFPIREGQEG